VTALGVFIVAVLTWRVAFNRLAHDPALEERVLIVGTGTTAQHPGAADQPAAGLRLPPRRLHRPSRERDARPPARHPRHRPTTSSGSSPTEVSTGSSSGSSDRRGRLPIQELLRAKMAGRARRGRGDHLRADHRQDLLDDLKPSWLIFSDGFQASRLTRLASACSTWCSR
jgi:hypothetical protein